MLERGYPPCLTRHRPCARLVGLAGLVSADLRRTNHIVIGGARRHRTVKISGIGGVSFPNFQVGATTDRAAVNIVVIGSGLGPRQLNLAELGSGRKVVHAVAERVIFGAYKDLRGSDVAQIARGAGRERSPGAIRHAQLDQVAARPPPIKKAC